MLRKTLMSAAVLVGLAATSANAQSNTFSAGTTFNSPVLTGFGTTGVDMTGMAVAWTYVDVALGGGNGVWGAVTGGYGIADASGFSILFPAIGTTFSNPWVVTNGSSSAVASIVFNGAPGRTIFDCAWTGTSCQENGSTAFQGTPGSAEGASFTTSGTYAGTVSGAYTNRVGIGINAPVGDLYEQLTIYFGGTGLGVDDTYSFIADTDNSDFNSPPPSVVPEPASMTLLATGLAGMAAARRRKKQK